MIKDAYLSFLTGNFRVARLGKDRKQSQVTDSCTICREQGRSRYTLFQSIYKRITKHTARSGPSWGVNTTSCLFIVLSHLRCSPFRFRLTFILSQASVLEEPSTFQRHLVFLVYEIEATFPP